MEEKDRADFSNLQTEVAQMKKTFNQLQGSTNSFRNEQKRSQEIQSLQWAINNADGVVDLYEFSYYSDVMMEEGED